MTGIGEADDLEDEDDDLTELKDAKFHRVDMVSKAANGTAFLIAKSARGGNGLLEDDIVRALVQKAAKDALAVMSSADLQRQALEGTAAEKQDALIELGKRSLVGEPAAAPSGEPIVSVPIPADGKDIQPAPPGDAGTPANVVKASAAGGAAVAALLVIAAERRRVAAGRRPGR